MAKVKITNSKGENFFVEKNGILLSKIITSNKEGENKGRHYLSLDYGDNKQILIGAFNDKESAENIIINDL